MADERRDLARRELARREIERRAAKPLAKAETIQQGPSRLQNVGRSVLGNLPQIGQAVGGVGGAFLGSKVGAPARGGAIGGTVGRGLGLSSQEFVKQFRKNPLETLANLALGGPLLGSLINASQADRKRIGKEVMSTAGIEGVLAVVTGGLSGAGKGALESLLGPRVAERGLKKGFKTLLDPKFFQDRVPKKIAFKTRQFFDKLSGVTGRGVKKSISNLDKKITVLTGKIKSNANTALKEQGADVIDDLGAATTSKAQINKVKEAKKIVDGLPDKATPSQVWNARKDVDKIRFRNNFDPEIERYLDSLRTSMNAPLKNASPEVAEAFGRYASVKEVEKDLGNKFRATLIDDEIFTPATEQFANNLLGTSKDETVRTLQKLDSFLGAEDKVIEDLLDVAATEALGNPFEMMGLFQRSILGALGGKKAVAGGAANLQSPGGRVIRGLINRGTAAGGTSLATGEPLFKQ